jgi:hypothetical protein
MMPGGFGQIADCLREHHRVREAWRVERTAQPAVADFPAGEVGEGGLELVIGQDVVGGQGGRGPESGVRSRGSGVRSQGLSKRK